MTQKQNNTYHLSAYNEEVLHLSSHSQRAMKGGAIIFPVDNQLNANYTQGHRNGMSYSRFECQDYLVLKLG